MKYFRITYALAMLTLMGIIGFGIYTVRSSPALIWLGYGSIAAAGLLLLMGLIVAGTFTINYWFDAQVIPVDQWGAYLKRRSKVTPLPPLTAVTPKVAGTKVTEVTPDVPRLGELIVSGSLVSEEDGKAVMLQGFRVDGSPRYGQWPGVVAITGMQNVGKTITMVSLIIIALLQGARVVVCDTHHTKSRSLYKKIQALDKYITFALTEQEVLQETQRFSQELQARKRGSSPYPYIIFYDELCSLIRARQVEELKEVIPTTMEEASQEGHGYGLHLVASIHDVSNSGIGDARLRGFWNWIYCHRMEAGQSKFIEAFKARYGSKKASVVISGLPPGHVMARDEVSTIEYLIMPNGDSRDALIALKKLEEMGLPRPGEQEHTQVERPFIQEQIAQHATYSPGRGPEQIPAQAQSELTQGESFHVGNMPAPAPGNLGEQGETSIIDGGNFTMMGSPGEYAQASKQEPISEQALTPEQEIESAIFRAVWELGDEGKKVTRVAIQDKLGWTHKRYTIIKQVCDKYGIAS